MSHGGIVVSHGAILVRHGAVLISHGVVLVSLGHILVSQARVPSQQHTLAYSSSESDSRHCRPRLRLCHPRQSPAPEPAPRPAERCTALRVVCSRHHMGEHLKPNSRATVLRCTLRLCLSAVWLAAPLESAVKQTESQSIMTVDHDSQRCNLKWRCHGLVCRYL